MSLDEHTHTPRDMWSQKLSQLEHAEYCQNPLTLSYKKTKFVAFGMSDVQAYKKVCCLSCAFGSSQTRTKPEKLPFRSTSVPLLRDVALATV